MRRYCALGAFVAVYGAAGLADRLLVAAAAASAGLRRGGDRRPAQFAVRRRRAGVRHADQPHQRSGTLFSFAAAALVSAVLGWWCSASARYVEGPGGFAVALFLLGLVVGTLSGCWLMRRLSPRINRAPDLRAPRRQRPVPHLALRLRRGR